MSMQTIKWILYYDEDWDSRNGFTLPRYYTFSFIIINLWLVCFYDYFTRNGMITKNFFVFVFFNQRLRISGEVTNNYYLSFNELKKEDVSITIECLLSSFLVYRFITVLLYCSQKTVPTAMKQFLILKFTIRNYHLYKQIEDDEFSVDSITFWFHNHSAEFEFSKPNVYI